MTQFQTVGDVIEALRANFRPEWADGVDAVVQLDASGENGGAYYFIVKDRRLEVNSGWHSSADAVISCEAATWLAVSNGRLNPMLAIMTGRIKVTGSVGSVMKLRAIFGL